MAGRTGHTGGGTGHTVTPIVTAFWVSGTLAPWWEQGGAGSDLHCAGRSMALWASLTTHTSGFRALQLQPNTEQPVLRPWISHVLIKQ